MEKDKIVIIGGKGTAVVVAEQIEDAILNYNYNAEVLGFAFDDPAFGEEINGYPILCKTNDVYDKFKGDLQVKFIFQLYRSDLLRERIQLRNGFDIPLERYYTFIHPSACISKSVKLGYGCVVLANCTINSNAVMGNFNTLNSNVLIGHDTVVEDNNFFAGHTCIGSGLRIGNGNFFGLNSSSKNLITINDYNIVGMAANVVKNVGSNQVLVGNPAKSLRKQ